MKATKGLMKLLMMIGLPESPLMTPGDAILSRPSKMMRAKKGRLVFTILNALLYRQVCSLLPSYQVHWS